MIQGKKKGQILRIMKMERNWRTMMWRSVFVHFKIFWFLVRIIWINLATLKGKKGWLQISVKVDKFSRVHSFFQQLLPAFMPNKSIEPRMNCWETFHWIPFERPFNVSKNSLVCQKPVNWTIERRKRWNNLDVECRMWKWWPVMEEVGNGIWPNKNGNIFLFRVEMEKTTIDLSNRPFHCRFATLYAKVCKIFKLELIIY